MDAKEFFLVIMHEINTNRDTFIKNMKNNGVAEEMDFCDWLDFFIRWMEWATDEDCEYAYGGRDGYTKDTE